MTPSRSDDAELELAVGDEVDNGLGVVHLERNPEVGMLLLELAEKDRNGNRGRPGRCPDRELAGESAGTLGRDLLEHLLLQLEQPLCAAEQPQPGLGRLDPAAGAVEELRPEPFFERPHLQGDGGLRDTESFGRL